MTLHQFHQKQNNAEGGTGVFDDIISNINKVIEGVRASAVGSTNAKVEPTANYQVQSDQPRMVLRDQPMSTTTERIVPPPAQENDDVAVTTSGRRVRAQAQSGSRMPKEDKPTGLLWLYQLFQKKSQKEN